MGGIIDDSLEIVRLFSEAAKYGEEEFGSPMAPARQADIDQIMMPGIAKELTQSKGQETLEADIARMEAQLSASLSEDQRIALAKKNQLLKKIGQRGEYHEEDEASREEDRELRYLVEAYHEALTPEQKDLTKKLESTRFELFLLTDDGKEMVEQLQQRFTPPGALGDEKKPKKLLSITLEGGVEKKSAALRVLHEAMQRKGLLMEDGDNEATGYRLVPDYNGTRVSLIAAEGAPDLAFDELAKEIDTTLREELCNKDNWKRTRSARGVAYEYEAQQEHPLLKETLWREWLKQGESKDIRRGVKDNGAFKPFGEYSEDELGSETKETYRVTGAAIKGLLVNKLGVEGLELPPVKER